MVLVFLHFNSFYHHDTLIKKSFLWNTWLRTSYVCWFSNRVGCFYDDCSRRYRKEHRQKQVPLSNLSILNTHVDQKYDQQSDSILNQSIQTDFIVGRNRPPIKKHILKIFWFANYPTYFELLVIDFHVEIFSKLYKRNSFIEINSCPFSSRPWLHPIKVFTEEDS